MGTLLLSADQKIVKPLQGEFMKGLTLVYKVVETGIRAGMAGRAVLLYDHNQRISVTISGDGHDVLIVAAGFALQPKLFSGTAPEAGHSLLHRDGKAFFVHISYGKNLLGDGINHNSGDQTVFVKF